MRISKALVLYHSQECGNTAAMPDIFKRVGILIGEPVDSRGKPDSQVLNKRKALGKELTKAVT